MSDRPGPEPNVRDEDIIRAIVAARPPALGTVDLADEFDISRQGMDKRLHQLYDEGKLNRQKVSGVNLWWPTDEGRQLVR